MWNPRLYVYRCWNDDEEINMLIIANSFEDAHKFAEDNVDYRPGGTMFGKGYVTEAGVKGII